MGTISQNIKKLELKRKQRERWLCTICCLLMWVRVWLCEEILYQARAYNFLHNIPSGSRDHLFGWLLMYLTILCAGVLSVVMIYMWSMVFLKRFIRDSICV